jgi:hypothetical protein
VKGGYGTRKGGGDTPKARAEDRTRTPTFFIHKTIVIYTYSEFFFPFHLLTIHHCDNFFFGTTNVETSLNEMKKKLKKFDAGDDDRPTIIADYHRKEALESPSRLCVCVCACGCFRLLF